VAAVVAAVGVWTTRPQAAPVPGLPAVTVDGKPGLAAGAANRGAASSTAGGVGGVAEGSAAGGAAGAGSASGNETAGGAAGAAGAAADRAAGGVLVVSVSGRVAHPGVVRVPDGARVVDVLAAAGGAQPGVDVSGLNLARRVVDGEQIAVGVPPAPDSAAQPPSAGSAGAGAGTSGPAVKVDLNTATVAQLDTLPGVGPVTAQHIVDWRTRNGRFARVNQLREIDGIGERRFQQLRGLVTI